MTKMFGNNPIRKILKSDGKLLEVEEIFPTIQGEGIYVGVTSVFLRLGGCNLACNFCDTEFESFEPMQVSQIIDEIDKLSLNREGKKTRKLVVITGGEPMRQPIEYLCEQLISLDYKVQIETNGTIYRDLHKDVKIVCSPKSTANGYTKIRDDLLKRVSAIKFIISANDKKYSNIVEVGQNDYDIPVYVQPMDEYDQEKNDLNLRLAMQIAEDKNCILSLQIHKILSIK